jgi:hypothetical protein
MAANAEMLKLYWDIGRLVASNKEHEGRGSGVNPRLVLDLKNDILEIKGFSECNLRRMIEFYREYPALFPIRPQPVAKLEF